MKENFIEETVQQVNSQKKEVERDFISNIKTLSEEEDRILKKIYSRGTIKKTLSDLIDKYTNTENIKNEDDIEYCKTIIVALKHDHPDESIVIKLVQFLANRFIDVREEFNDRACIVSAVLFRKDNFDIFSRKSIKNFESLLPKYLLENKKKIEKVKEEKPAILNSKLSHDDFQENQLYYHSDFNPMFLQRALAILKEDNSSESVKAVHLSFESILSRASDRVFRHFSKEIFIQLTEISDFDLLEYQFKSLAFLMKRDINFYHMSLKLFLETKSEVLKTYLIFAFDLLESFVNYDLKVEIHLAFAEALSSLEMELEPSTKEAATSFIQKGINLLKTTEI